MVRSVQSLRAKINAARAISALACVFLGQNLLAQETIVVNEPVFVPEGGREALELPLDELAPSDIENANAVEIEEIVLEKDAEIVIPPFKSIIIQNLVAAEGAKIQLAHSDSGDDGAHARFFVRRINGHIVVESRGQDGRDGRNGRHGRRGLDGERGRNARTLIFGLIWLGDGEDGRPGYPGENGEDGEDGEDGGNGGELTMYYLEKSAASKILMDVAGGRAGEAGKPGMGGLGGNGGKGGEGWKDGDQGPMGRRGQNGKAGRPGRPGHSGRAAIYQVPESLYRCLMVLDAMASVERLTDEDYNSCRNPEAPPTRSRPLAAKPIVQSNSDFEVSEENGILYINADGEDGRSGFDATSGTNGGSMTIFVRDLPVRAILSSRGGNGGNGGHGSRGQRGGDGHDGRNASLFKKAQAGENGRDGGHGGNGSDGGHGGQGGHIRIVYLTSEDRSSEDWTRRFEANFEGGMGGAGGRGAEGGEGGRGGRGGKKFWSKDRLPDGWPGVHGDRGRDGRDGSDGEIGHLEFFEAFSTTDWIIDEFKAELERH